MPIGEAELVRSCLQRLVPGGPGRGRKRRAPSCRPNLWPGAQVERRADCSGECLYLANPRGTREPVHACRQPARSLHCQPKSAGKCSCCYAFEHVQFRPYACFLPDKAIFESSLLHRSSQTPEPGRRTHRAHSEEQWLPTDAGADLRRDA
jgi:hypothetical protein